MQEAFDYAIQRADKLTLQAVLAACELSDLQVDLNKPTREGAPIALMAAWDRWDIVGVLLGAGANVHGQKDSGWTALHFAAQHGRLDAMRALISAGANINAGCSTGLGCAAVLDVAAMHGHRLCVQFLLDLRARYYTTPTCLLDALHKRWGAATAAGILYGIYRRRMRSGRDVAGLIAQAVWQYRWSF